MSGYNDGRNNQYNPPRGGGILDTENQKKEKYKDRTRYDKAYEKGYKERHKK